MEEGTFICWLKNNGDFVQKGEPLFTLEGEKAAQDIEAAEAGVLQLSDESPQPGDTVKVGAVLALLLEANESPAQVTPKPPSEPQNAPSTKPACPVSPARPPEPMLNESHPPVAGAAALATFRISPRAARRAVAMGVAWQSLRGTGRNGRIRERDVLAAAMDTAAAPNNSQIQQTPGRSDLEFQLAGRLTPMTPTRRTIASRLSDAARATVPVTLTTQVDATHLVRLRVKLKKDAMGTASIAPTFLDILVQLAVRALREHPLLTAQWHESGLFFPDPINIAIAVDMGDGLLTPVLREVTHMTLDQIAATSRRLIEKARARRLQAADLEGGTFTITNLGGLGIDAFTPVLNPPQCAILGMGRIRQQAVVIASDVVPRETITLSLTFDHRIVDGTPAARFLETLSRLIVSADV